jgi:hypothetical protein
MKMIYNIVMESEDGAPEIVARTYDEEIAKRSRRRADPRIFYTRVRADALPRPFDKVPQLT